MIAETVAISRGLKKIRKVMSNGERNHDDPSSHESDKRRSRLPRYIGGAAVIGLVAGGGFYGVQRAFDRNPLVTNESVAHGGDAEIVSFKDDYEAHCWTATEIQVRGAGIKEETKVAGASLGWKESKVDVRVENNLCIDATTLTYEVNPNTKQVKIDIPNKDDIRTQTNIILGTQEPYGDQSIGYALTKNATTLLESIPFIEDTDLSKDLSKNQDKQESMELNVGSILAAKLANDKCHDEVWGLAKEPVEKGVTRLLSLGMTVAKAMYPEANMSDANISVTVAGTPMSQVKVAGNVTNIDAAYKSIKEFDEKNDSFSILTPDNDTCKTADDVKKVPTDPALVTKTVAKESSNE